MPKIWLESSKGKAIIMDFKRNNRIRFFTLIFLAIIICTFDSACADNNKDTLFQVSTINALLEGLYDGDVGLKEIKGHGDFGIGTFDKLDGEMIFLDGKFYQVKYDGNVSLINDDTKSPFAVVTFFETDKSQELADLPNYKALTLSLDKLLPTRNIFYAIKINGNFEYIKTRSVPSQKKPYPKLIEVAKKQSIFEFDNIDGTIVGFYAPGFIKGVNVPGYHLHFISRDKKGGGHLLDCRIKNVTVELDDTHTFIVELPESDSFHGLDLTREQNKELEKIER